MSALRKWATAAAFLVSGCAEVANGPAQGVTPDQRFPISVEPQIQTYRLPFNGAGFDPIAQREFEHVASDYLENGSGTVTVSSSTGGAVASARVADELAALGIQKNRITVVPASATDAPRTAIISYIRYGAVANSCGNWSESLAVTYLNRTSPNFGCATQHNLAAMIADPRDLVAPKPLGDVNIARRLNVLDKYGLGEITSAAKSSAQSGAVSNVSNTGGGGGNGGPAQGGM